MINIILKHWGKIVLAVVMSMGVLNIKSCLFPNKPVKPDVPLQENEKMRFTVNPKKNSVIIVTEEGQITKYVPPSGSVTVTLQKDGSHKSSVRNKGLCFTPGFGVGFADKIRFLADVEFAYWNRLTLHTGIGFNKNPLAVGYAGVGYNLDQIGMSNSSFVGSYTTKKVYMLSFVARF